MTTRIDLGNGQFADVKDVDDLRSGDRDAVDAAVKVEIDPESATGLLPGDFRSRQRKALAARVIEGWNLQHPLPSKRPDSLGKLTFEQEDKLFEGLAAHFKAVSREKDDADFTEPAVASLATCLAGGQPADRDKIPWRQLRYVMYAREFGWTPDEVDALRLRDEPWLLPVQTVIEKDLARRREAARLEAERKQGSS